MANNFEQYLIENRIDLRDQWDSMGETEKFESGPTFLEYCKVQFSLADNKLRNALLEVATMIESGSIPIGALGISQESADFIQDYAKAL